MWSPSLTTLLALTSLLPRVFANTYTNPIRPTNGSDPFLVYTGGYYYLLTTTWTDIEITRSTTLEGLSTATPKVIYSSDATTYCCNVWSPEVHYLDSTWYIYYTAGDASDLDDQNIHVLTGGATPWDSFSYTGQLTTSWSIDGTVLRFNDWGNYLAFSCFNGGSLQSLCVAPLNTPTSLGSTSIISTPTESWEEVSVAVNEAPAALYNDGKTFLTYSGSYCWTSSYALGLLTWDGETNPAESAAWSKSGPVFSSANGNYGPGSNGFFTSPDGTETWIVYNADASSAGACDGTRYTNAQVLDFNSDGTPSFGSPVATGVAYAAPAGESG